MTSQKFYSFLGLCQKSGQLVSGETGVNSEFKKNNIKLLILAEDISENTKEKYLYQAKKRKVESIVLGNKDLLGSAIGKNYRVIVGIKDKNMAENLMKIYKEE